MSNWNGKVKCTRQALVSMWKENKIYKVINGRVEQEEGYYTDAFENFEDFQRGTLSTFEEISIPQPHKSLLKSGMKVVYREGSYRYVLLETNGLYNPCTCNFSLPISEYNENLIRSSDISSPYDIMEIYNGEILIAKREEKSAKDIKIEELEKRMRELADEIAELKGE